MHTATRYLPLLFLAALGCGGGGGGGQDEPEPLPLATFFWSGTGAGNDYAAAADAFPDGSTILAGHIEDTLALEGRDDFVDLDDLAGTLLLARFEPDGSLAWARVDGGRTGVAARDVTALADGSCLVTGSFVGTATFGLGDEGETTFSSRGGTDVFVARYASDGALSWARQAGGSTIGDPSRRVIGDLVEEIDAFADGSFVVCGVFSSDLALGEEERRIVLEGGGGFCTFIARYAADGALQWAHELRNTAGSYTHVAARADGSCLLIGLTPGTEQVLRLGSLRLRRSEDGWTYLAAFDAAGEVLWLRGEGPDAQVVPWDLATAADGAFVVAGEMLGPAEGLAGSPVVLTPPLAGRRAFLARYDAFGQTTWARKDDSVAHISVALRSNGAPVVAGAFQGHATLADAHFDRGDAWGSYLARFHADGHLEAARAEGGAGTNLLTYPGTLTVLRDGRIAFSASFQGEATLGEETASPVTLSSRGAWDLFFAVYDATAGLAGAP